MEDRTSILEVVRFEPKARPGRPSDPKTQLRKEIVHKHIRKAGDFFAPRIKKELIDELTTNKIAIPKDKDSFLYASGWATFLKPPGYKWQRVVENVLSRDRWTRNRPKPTTESRPN